MLTNTVRFIEFCYSFVIYLTLFVVLIYLAFCVYERLTTAICQSKKSLEGKTAIVTGGTAGMGLEIAAEFAKRGARVIIACPFEKEGYEGLQYIIKKTGSNKVIFKLLDLSSLHSVKKFADDIIKTEDKLNILVNNAGVYSTKEYTTTDGMSLTMQINYFGHFLLTLMLIPLLKNSGLKSNTSRIVNVTSLAHFVGKIDLKHINDIKCWNSFQIYANSKLCLTIFTRELAKRLNGSNIVVNNADPGMVPTFIIKFKNVIFKTIYYVLVIVTQRLIKKPEIGAQTAIYAALDEEAGEVSGERFFRCKLSRASKKAYDEELAKKLWTESLKLVKFNDLE